VGTRGKWTMLTGDVSGTPVTLAILDHPKNVGFPRTGTRGIRLVRRKPARSEGDEQRQGGVELQARAESVGDVPPRSIDSGRKGQRDGHREVLRRLHALILEAVGRSISITVDSLRRCPCASPGGALHSLAGLRAQRPWPRLAYSHCVVWQD